MNGSLTQNGTADYAEYFEWEDQNLNNQDRTGYFVSLDKDKIKQVQIIIEPQDGCEPILY